MCGTRAIKKASQTLKSVALTYPEGQPTGFQPCSALAVLKYNDSQQLRYYIIYYLCHFCKKKMLGNCVERQICIEIQM